MRVPNWKHHSKKEQKRKLKPQAMRARRAALNHFKKCHKITPFVRVGFYNMYIPHKQGAIYA